MHKSYIFPIILFVLLSACSSDKDSLNDQGRTSSCWIYAMLACIEQEQALVGDTVRLSRQWLLARYMEEQTMRLYLMRQRGENATPPTSDQRQGFTLYGLGPEALRLINDYGLVPYEHERTHVTSGRVLVRRLTEAAQTAGSVEQLRDTMHRLLPSFTTSQRENAFYYYSMRYTPQQFAESIMYHQHWQFYATEPQHPWGEMFPLEVACNYRYHLYCNMPMNEILQRIMASLRSGHAVYWEYGANGPSSDHAMAIVGIERGKDGRELLLCRDSYGLPNLRRVTTEYFLSHTCNVGIIQKN